MSEDQPCHEQGCSRIKGRGQCIHVLAWVKDKTVALERIAYVARINEGIIQLIVTKHPRQKRCDGNDERDSEPQPWQLHPGIIPCVELRSRARGDAANLWIYGNPEQIPADVKYLA